MPNIMDYVAWRGDSLFAEVPFNEVDALIFCTLSYVRWEDFLPESGTAALESVLPDPDARADEVKLLGACARSRRFGSQTAANYVSELDLSGIKQFSAVTFLLDDGTIFIACRGTDKTLAGWKEDFHMAFSDPIPSQLRAAQYLKRTAERFGGLIRIGGHSKGGNLAVFAASYADDAVRPRLTDIYTLDGPGQSEKVFASPGYAAIRHRIRSFVPQSSLVGMLLEHPDEYEVVKSGKFSILQHDPFNWHVLGPSFVRADSLQKDSVRFERVMREWLAGADEEKRRAFVDALCDILSATDAQYVGRDFFLKALRSPQAMITAFRNVDEDTRRKVTDMIGALVTASLPKQLIQGKEKLLSWADGKEEPARDDKGVS